MRTTILAIAAMAAMVPAAFGAVSLSISDSAGLPNVSEILLPGDSFTLNLDLGITGGEQVSGVGYFLRSDNGSGYFRLSGRTNESETLIDYTTTNNTAINNALNNLLNPVNARDLGGTADPEGDQATVSHLMHTVTLTVEPGVPAGTYTIELDRPSWNDPAATAQLPFDSVGSPYTVQVVPEPVSALLLVLGGLFVTRRRMA